MTKETEFDKWYDDYFCDTQGEDSPYSYNDLKMAFLRGMKVERQQTISEVLEIIEKAEFHKSIGYMAINFKEYEKFIKKIKELKGK